jgi:hypothetical protein
MLIVNLGQYSDAVRQACAPTEIRIVASGRFEMMTDFHRTVLLPRSHDIHGGHFVAAAREYERYFEQVRERRPSADVFEGQFLEAFEAEYGTSIDMAIAFVSALQNHALAKGTYILELEEAELRAIALAETVDTAAVNAILSSFVLPERERWDEAEPQGFRRKDWYPWRYRRRLSLVSRPIVRVTGAGRAVYLICPGLLETGLRNIILRSAEGSLPEDYFLTGQMKTWIGKANNRRGHTFNEFVAERLREAELRARCNVKLSEIAAGTLNENLGDVDVLAWDVATGRVLVIECKDLHEARTVGEVAEQLRRFRGGYDEGRPDELRRHLRRVEWLSENPALLGQLLNIRVDRIRVEPYLMFSNRVPLKYVDGLPLPSRNIITIDEIQTLN